MARLGSAAATALGLGLLAGPLAAQAPVQRQQVEQLYAEDTDAWSRHDVARILSLFDPGLVLVAPDGARTSYQQWRGSLQPALARERDLRIRAVIKDDKAAGDGFVAIVDWQENYAVYDATRSAWVPMMLSAPQADTWKPDGLGNFRISTVKFLPGALPETRQVADSVPLSAMVDHDAQLVAFLVGGALSPEERQRIAAFAAAKVQLDANAMYRNDAELSKDLQLIHDHPGAISAEQWMNWRWRSALAAPEAADGRIVAAHDPVLAFDRERSTLITEQTLRSLRDATAWAAEQTGRSPPDARYIEDMRETIEQQWQTWPDETLTSLTYIVRNFPAMVEYTEGVMSDQQRREFFTSWAKELGREPQSTLRTAATMAHFYDLLLQEKIRQTTQVLNWQFLRARQNGLCKSIYGGFAAGAGPYGCQTFNSRQ